MDEAFYLDRLSGRIFTHPDLAITEWYPLVPLWIPRVAELTLRGEDIMHSPDENNPITAIQSAQAYIDAARAAALFRNENAGKELVREVLSWHERIWREIQRPNAEYTLSLVRTCALRYPLFYDALTEATR